MKVMASPGDEAATPTAVRVARQGPALTQPPVARREEHVGGIDRPHVPDLMTLNINATDQVAAADADRAPGLVRHDQLSAPAAKPRTLRYSQPPASPGPGVNPGRFTPTVGRSARRGAGSADVRVVSHTTWVTL
jgi:hypothetical protein